MEEAGARYAIRTRQETVLHPVSIEQVEDPHRLRIDPAMRRFFWGDEVIPRERAEAAAR